MIFSERLIIFYFTEFFTNFASSLVSSTLNSHSFIVLAYNLIYFISPFSSNIPYTKQLPSNLKAMKSPLYIFIFTFEEIIISSINIEPVSIEANILIFKAKSSSLSSVMNFYFNSLLLQHNFLFQFWHYLHLLALQLLHRNL